MNNSTKLAGAVSAAAVALLLGGCATSQTKASAVAGGDKAEVKCYGQNACKQTADCKTANNACKGQNTCKGQGFLLIPKKDCDKGTIKA